MLVKNEEKIRTQQLKDFTIKNFKAFRECTLSLPPLTILIGENSSGKSSLLQALLLLKQTLEGPSGGGILELDSHYVQFHQFREIIFGMPSRKEAYLVLGLKFEDFQIEFGVVDEATNNAINDDLESSFTFRTNETSFEDSHMARLVPDEFLFKHPEYYRLIHNFFKNIGYIQPIRPAPERFYTLSGIKPRWIGVQAENVADFLEASPKIKKKVRDWFVKSTKLASEVKFKSDRDRGQMEILFTEAATNLKIDISRLGFGYSQILPIVVAAFSDMNMLIFEAPEIHLNPNLHGVLTDLFVEGANNGKQVLVETHSEHVIYRIQRRIADGTIAPENVAIYYVRRGAEGSVAERLKLTKEGEIPDWPDGFFETEMEDIYQRIIASTKD